MGSYCIAKECMQRFHPGKAAGHDWQTPGVPSQLNGGITAKHLGSHWRPPGREPGSLDLGQSFLFPRDCLPQMKGSSVGGRRPIVSGTKILLFTPTNQAEAIHLPELSNGLMPVAAPGGVGEGATAPMGMVGMKKDLSKC